MSRERGFTLVELLVVISIMGIILAIVTHNWREMNVKSRAENQIKQMQADLMEIQLQAIHAKAPRSVVISGATMKIYASDDTTVAPISSKQLSYPVLWDPEDTSPLTFSPQGIARGVTADKPRSFCIAPNSDLTVSNPAAVDSLIISPVRINLGKRRGGDCTSVNIDQR